MSRILIAALMGWLVIFSAQAADTPHNEIVYRANLGRADDVKLLLKQGISPDDKSDDGVPLLALAAARKDEEGLNVVKLLIDSGAAIEGRDSHGQTALFYAVRQGNMKTVHYLLAKGADYYALDASGNTARNLAYTSGQKDIGVAIDDFVKQQGVERAKQYEEFNKALAERLKATQQPPQPASAVTADAQPVPVESVKTTEEKLAQEILEKKRQEEIKQLTLDLAFNSCAFQYWSYISDTGQSTELSADKLDAAIDSYKDKIVALEDRFINEYNESPPLVKKIVNSAKRLMFNQLSTMPSKSYRHEEGVGKEDDMQSRCKTISRRWDKESPPPPAVPQKKK